MRRNKKLDAVKLMREIRDRIAKEEEGLNWEQRKKRLHRDLEANPLWGRFKTLAHPAKWEEPILRL